jgi:hypothetical protein
VAERVVDHLEPVQVDVEQAHRAAVAAGACETLLEVLRQQRAVRQLGERVVVGQEGDLLLGAAALRDVRDRRDDERCLAGALERLVVDRHPARLAAQLEPQQDVARRLARDERAALGPVLVGDDRAVVEVELQAERRDRPADHVRLDLAEDLERTLVALEDLAALAEQHDALLDRVEHPARELARDLDPAAPAGRGGRRRVPVGLRCDERRDVVVGQDHLDQPPALREQRRRADLVDPGAAVAPPRGDRAAEARALLERVGQPPCRGRVLVVEEEARVAADHLVARVAGQPLEGGVRPQDGATGSRGIRNRYRAIRSAEESLVHDERLVSKSLACVHMSPPARGQRVLSPNGNLPCLPWRAIIHAASRAPALGRSPS